MIELFDSHAHVHDKAFADDRTAVVDRMRAAGVKNAVCVGCDLEDSRRALAAAREYDLYASAGIHPHEAKDAPADLREALEPLLRDERTVAIGETGLDYYYDHSPRDAQQRVLRAHLRLARECGKPVIFHHRDAFDDFIAVLREEWHDGMRGVIHCFTGTPGQARTYVREFGLFLGIGGVVTFKTAQPVRDAVLAVGIEPIVLETDCPYLAPVPHRGKRNEPAFTVDTARCVANLLGSPIESIADVTTGNARALFGLTS